MLLVTVITKIRMEMSLWLLSGSWKVTIGRAEEELISTEDRSATLSIGLTFPFGTKGQPMNEE